jgi:hypothetical protein
LRIAVRGHLRPIDLRRLVYSPHRCQIVNDVGMIPLRFLVPMLKINGLIFNSGALRRHRERWLVDRVCGNFPRSLPADFSLQFPPRKLKQLYRVHRGSVKGQNTISGGYLLKTPMNGYSIVAEAAIARTLHIKMCSIASGMNAPI